VSKPPQRPYDLEELAAFIDRRLGPEPRKAVERRLVLDDDYYELYRETIDQVEALPGAVEPSIPAAQRTAARVSPLTGGRRRAQWLTAGAALAAAAIAALIVVPRWFPRPFDPEPLVAELGGAGSMADRFGGEHWVSVGWSVNRSAGAEAWPNLTPAQQAFRLGVRTLDLSVALRGGDRAAAIALVGQIEALLSRDPFAIAEQAAYADLHRGLIQGEGEAIQAAAEAEQWLRSDRPDSELESFETGQWTELARLAARSRSSALFQAEAFRRRLDQLQRQTQSPKVEKALAAIAAELAAAQPGYPGIERALEILFVSYGG